MNITDIQFELRKMEEKLLQLDGYLEDLKPKSKANDIEDYKKIENLAKRNPIKTSKLMNADEFVKKNYLKFLSMLVAIDGRDSFDKFLFIKRISCGIGYDLPIGDIVVMGTSISEEDLTDIEMSLENYKYNLIVDSLILANIKGNVSDELIKVISTMADYLKCDKEDMKVLVTVSKCVLINNFDKLDRLEIKTNKWSGVFTHYIPKSWLEKRRLLHGKERDVFDDTIAKKLRVFYIGKIRKDIKNGSLILKGDIITELYEGFMHDYYKESNMKAKKDGIISIIEENKDDYNDKLIYVISFFDDYRNLK